MKFEISQKIIALSLVFAFALLAFSSCQSGGSQPATGPAQTPTEAYKMLYAAVKSKDTEKIKQMMSKDSIGLVEMQAAKTNQPIEKVFSNGLTATTLSASLPQIRDERVNGNFGAIEVWNEKQREWEDLPFVQEDGAWKLAIGNLFSGKFESPGKPQSIKEREAANLSNPNHGMIPMTNANANGNTGTIKKIPIPQPPATTGNAANGATNK
jgi:ketosteroid isomerase-like protein